MPRPRLVGYRGFDGFCGGHFDEGERGKVRRSGPPVSAGEAESGFERAGNAGVVDGLVFLQRVRSELV